MTCNNYVFNPFSASCSKLLFQTASRILRLQPRVFLYLFISVSILHCTELQLSTLNKEYMIMMMTHAVNGKSLRITNDIDIHS